MAPKKIVVFGVTGVQGGSVARALLEDGPEKFEVWGVTRSKTSKKAQGELGSRATMPVSKLAWPVKPWGA